MVSHDSTKNDSIITGLKKEHNVTPGQSELNISQELHDTGNYSRQDAKEMGISPHPVEHPLNDSYLNDLMETNKNRENTNLVNTEDQWLSTHLSNLDQTNIAKETHSTHSKEENMSKSKLID